MLRKVPNQVWIIGSFLVLAVLLVIIFTSPPEHRPDCMTLDPNTVDKTIPDGTVLQGDTTQLKTWTVSNCGKEWNNYHLVRTYNEGFVNQADLKFAATSSSLVPNLSHGKTGDITVGISAPTKPGRYLLQFEVANDSVHRFGPVLWVIFVVQ